MVLYNYIMNLKESYFESTEIEGYFFNNLQCEGDYVAKKFKTLDFNFSNEQPAFGINPNNYCFKLISFK